MKIIVTGGAGFIGSAVVSKALESPDYTVMNLDKLTYAANLEFLETVALRSNYDFRKTDICDANELKSIFDDFRPHAVMHLAAESHVDRSISGPSEFINTNIVGTSILLAAATGYWRSLKGQEHDSFRFLHVSTDEVFGDLGPHDAKFNELTPYAPSSPYSASKASSDHLVRAWGRTYGLPILITNCSNNYGPRHYPEKLIPLVITSALTGKSIPVYGDGQNVRDWLYVDDHAVALLEILKRGKVSETYLIGGNNEVKNIDLVNAICDELERQSPASGIGLRSYKDLITFVGDRPGHDHRYAVDSSKLKNEIGIEPNESLESGLGKTVAWYLENRSWWERILNGSDRAKL